MPSKADVKAWKAQLVAQAEQQVLKLTDSGQFKKYLNTLAKFHHYSARNIDLIYAQNPQATQVAGFKQWQTDFNRTVNRGAKSIRIAAPIIKKLTPAEQKRLDTTDERAIVGYRYLPIFDVAQTSGDPVLSAKDFVFTMQNLAKNHDKLTVVNDQMGRPTWTRTLAEFMAYLVKTNAAAGTYQLSNDNTATWYDFAKEILKNTDVEVVPVTSEQFPQKAFRPRHSVMNLSKAKKTGFIIPDWKSAVAKLLSE